jgi:single-strand DNA-binding protein
MASSLNQAQIIGNLTRDPELKQTPTGQTVATFGLATNRKWKDQAGQLQEEVEFHNIVAWGRLAEICGQYLKKGAKAYVSGRLKTRTWDDPEGKKNYKTEIIAEDLVMLDSRPRDGSAPAYTPAPAKAPAAATPKPAATADVPEEEIKIDDLPF